MSRLIYLDYAATTPILPEISQAMIRCLSVEGDFGNPASQSHHYGWDAAKHITTSRQHVANLIHAKPQEIIWTSGATESNNLAIKGTLDAYKHKNKHIITSKIEHKAVLDTCAELESLGFQVTYLQPELGTGVIRPEQVKQAIQPNTVLISLMMVNNEIGTLTDIQAIGLLAHKHQILFHVDAAQAAGKTQIDVQAMQIDLLSLSAHKIYGPKGIGALYVRQDIQKQIKTQIHGGGHEQGLRSGTLATHQIVGMGEACRLAKLALGEEQQRIQHLRNKLLQGLQALTPVNLNGHATQHVANYLNVSFLGERANSIIATIKQVAAVSSGSACNSHHAAPSHVLSALGLSENLASNTVRLSFGRYTTQDHIEILLKHLVMVLKEKKATTQLSFV
ncbi:cysteine desulfurase (tRNA sulfurtransferase), PLP-dependent [Acinetobacter sp. 8I-beige]|uniref:cysteine desulfurase family protein n=1 Tax=Acinetobacter sp. 8I-beige TaxID=2653125 RepID=UPI0012F07901|nr:aminotransferase class V-fold PLP-dependent enzyme [Acinetobacter sp. 8I-beige]VXA84213.1 cysteine desulfurase (tRNA sulfurtransferase), PLP-dependent [Acinetobacter sp. 8I-beige]